MSVESIAEPPTTWPRLLIAVAKLVPVAPPSEPRSVSTPPVVAR